MGKKSSRKKTPKAKKVEAVADNYAGLEKAKPVTDPQHFEQLMGTTYSRPSTAKSRPVDEEGVPYLQSHELSSLFGVHPDTVKRWTHTREIPHYVEQKGLGRKTAGQDPLDVDVLQRGTRTWFKHSEVVDFLNNQGHLAGPVAQAHLDRIRGGIDARKKAGETVPTLHDNPEHPTLAARLIHFGGGRQVTPDLNPPRKGRDDVFKEAMYTSNIMEALRSGSGRVVGDENK